MAQVPVLLAPVGRAEPDDVQGWIEHGGLRALQLALALPPAALRQRLTGLARRDGGGPLCPRVGHPVALTVGASASPARFLVEEIPLWVLGGALLLGLANEQPTLTVHLPLEAASLRSLLREVVQGLEGIGLVGAAGWLRGSRVTVTATTAPQDALDPVTAHLLSSVIVTGRDPKTTLLTLVGHAPLPCEVPLGQSVADLLASLTIAAHPDSLALGSRRLDGDSWQAPLTFETFGQALGSGRLTLTPAGNTDD